MANLKQSELTSLFLQRRTVALIVLTSAMFLLLGGALYWGRRGQEERQERELAPGLTLLSVQTLRPEGTLRYWLVKADRTRWNLGLQVPNAQDVTLKRTVRSFATQTNAPVAINGGFFAYAGAAVGAVKVAGQWHRLPWKSRTALGWNDQEARIDTLSGSCQLTLTSGAGSVRTEEAALNGSSRASSSVAVTNGYVVLTSQFAPRYQLRGGEVAAIVQGGQITSRLNTPTSIPLPKDGFLLVARGLAAEELKTTEPDVALRGAAWKVDVLPEWDKFAQILGAGPRLVRDEAAYTTERQEEFRSDVTVRGPRTCVGWDKDQNWLFLVVDGWVPRESGGLTLPNTGVLFQQLGAVQAMNLDGGASTQLVVNGELLNHPPGFDALNPKLSREAQVSNALTLKPR